MDKICRGSVVGDLHKQGYRIEGAAECSASTARGCHISLHAYKLERGSAFCHNGSAKLTHGSDTYSSRAQDCSPTVEQETKAACMDSQHGTKCLQRSSSKENRSPHCLGGAAKTSPRLQSPRSPRAQSPQDAWFRHKYGSDNNRLQYTDHRFWRNQGGYSPAPAPKQYPVAVCRDNAHQGQKLLASTSASALSPRLQSASACSKPPLWGPANPEGRSQRKPGAKSADQPNEGSVSQPNLQSTANLARRKPGPPRCADGNTRPALRLGDGSMRHTMGPRSMSSLLASTAGNLSSREGVPSRKSLGR